MDQVKQLWLLGSRQRVFVGRGQLSITAVGREWRHRAPGPGGAAPGSHVRRWGGSAGRPLQGRAAWGGPVMEERNDP